MKRYGNRGGLQTEWVYSTSRTLEFSIQRQSNFGESHATRQISCESLIQFDYCIYKILSPPILGKEGR